MTLSHVLDIKWPGDSEESLDPEQMAAKLLSGQPMETEDPDDEQTFWPARMPILGANTRRVREKEKDLAVLGGFGVARNANTVLILPPVPTPGSAMVAASLLPPQVDTRPGWIRSTVNDYLAKGRAAVEMRIDPDPDVEPPPSLRAAQLRSSDPSGETAVLSGAGDIAELSALTAEALAKPVNPDARVMILGIDPHSRLLARHLVRDGVRNDRVWLSADHADPATAERATAKARRHGLQVTGGPRPPTGGPSRRRK